MMVKFIRKVRVDMDLEYVYIRTAVFMKVDGGVISDMVTALSDFQTVTLT